MEPDDVTAAAAVARTQQHRRPASVASPVVAERLFPRADFTSQLVSRSKKKKVGEKTPDLHAAHCAPY